MSIIGSIDRLKAVFGQRGTGKSTFAIEDALNFRDREGAIVMGHSPGARFPLELPSGRKADYGWHDSIKSLERGLQRKPEKFHILTQGSPHDVIDYARRLSLAVRRRAVEAAGWKFRSNRPLPGKIDAPPILVIIDEATAMKERFTDDDKIEWQKFLTGLRHEHISLTWLIQSPSARGWVLTEQSNHIVTFRYVHEWGLNWIRAAGVPKEDIHLIGELENYEMHEWRFDRPRSKSRVS